MEKKVFEIPNISCGHCTMAIENELKEMPGVIKAEGNIEAKTVTVEWDSPTTLDAILNKLKDINYPAKS